MTDNGSRDRPKPDARQGTSSSASRCDIAQRTVRVVRFKMSLYARSGLWGLTGRNAKRNVSPDPRSPARRRKTALETALHCVSVAGISVSMRQESTIPDCVARCPWSSLDQPCKCSPKAESLAECLPNAGRLGLAVAAIQTLSDPGSQESLVKDLRQVFAGRTWAILGAATWNRQRNLESGSLSTARSTDQSCRQAHCPITCSLYRCQGHVDRKSSTHARMTECRRCGLRRSCNYLCRTLHCAVPYSKSRRRPPLSCASMPGRTGMNFSPWP